jgi:hypothetical protein
MNYKNTHFAIRRESVPELNHLPRLTTGKTWKNWLSAEWDSYHLPAAQHVANKQITYLIFVWFN